MCDTLIATQIATGTHAAIFGKNSDRDPNEGQSMQYFPARDYEPGARLKCTYIEIPQARHTHAVFLSKPYWMWGAEMGINEHGLVIGNEAVFSKIPANKTPALLGMDLLRAALERAVTPREAIQVITSLLEEFGQGGNCAHQKKVYYHNSFIIANHEEAWTLETIDRQWAARQIKDSYSISNCLTIGAQYDLSSNNLSSFARGKENFDMAKDMSDFLFTTFGKGRQRRETTANQLKENAGRMDIQTMLKILRHHKDPNFNPQDSLTEMDVCMHFGFGPIRGDQSTASMVAQIEKDDALIFVTGTSAPCTSVFKPVWLNAAPLLPRQAEPTGKFDPASIFWKHEKLHRATLLNYAERIQTYAADRDALEEKFIRGALELKHASAKERADFSMQCFREAEAAEAEWLKRVEKVRGRAKFPYSMALSKFNKRAGMAVK